jgi:hypothetical protein
MTTVPGVVVSEQPLTAYPRPQMVRDSYLNLNGRWDYAIRKSSAFPSSYDGKILVPFSPEAPLSGVGRQTQPDETLFYARTFTLPADFCRGRILLHVGAVDQVCEVFVNGRRAGRHVGGYLPFSFAITDAVHDGENELRLRVRDVSDTSCFARGKQKLKRGGMWYTAQSGIWQSVWLESVPRTYIRSLKIDPDFDGSTVTFRIFPAGEDADAQRTGRVSIFDGQMKTAEASFRGNQPVTIPLPHFKSWSPEEPFLYHAEVTYGEDTVRTYFAMRKLSMGPDKNGILRFLLNNKPCFHNGLLDQGYWPDGLYTAPTDDALKNDILQMKRMGFNMIRKHCKIEPDRWYYYCDTIGMLVWQDAVCGGSSYHMGFVCFLPNFWMPFGRLVRDSHYRAFARADAKGRRMYRRELKEMVHLLYNHPSIAAWVPFNEGWGQFDANKATALVRKCDPARLIDEASGWFDQRGGDMYSIHNYWRKLKVRPQKKRAVALTEYGGYSLHIDGHSSSDTVYGYRHYKSRAELMRGLTNLFEKEIIPAIRNGLSAAVYTQLSDVEEEVNGLLTYDREIVKADADAMLALNREVYAEFEKRTN